MKLKFGSERLSALHIRVCSVSECESGLWVCVHMLCVVSLWQVCHTLCVVSLWQVPEQRNSHAMVSLGRTVILFGGSSPDDGPMNDLYALACPGVLSRAASCCVWYFVCLWCHREYLGLSLPSVTERRRVSWI